MTHLPPQLTSHLTPMMQQYREMKRKYPDCLLLFRMGDFYELFEDDAEIASRTLAIALTTRDRGKENPVPMCGVPWHSVETYLTRLVQAGHKVAICDQIEDPRQAVGLVRREVVRVVTPGTFDSEGYLRSDDPSFVAAVASDGQRWGLAFLDVTTGEFLALEEEGTGWEGALQELERMRPRELVACDALARRFRETDGRLASTQVETRPDWAFDPEWAEQMLREHFGTVSLDGFGCAGRPWAVAAAGGLLHYVREVEGGTLRQVTRLRVVGATDRVLLDPTTLRNLEVLRPLEEDLSHKALVDLMDETVTPMGARLLRRRLLYPSRDLAALEARLDAVQELVEGQQMRERLRETLKGVADVARTASRLASGRAGPREVAALGAALVELPRLRETLSPCSSAQAASWLERWDDMAEEAEAIARALAEPVLHRLQDGDVIRDGYDNLLDEYRRFSREGKSWIAELEKKEKESTGIGALRVGYNKVFGYYIEVPRRLSGQVPPHYIRRQTLVNAERYVTEELKAYEEKVLQAEEKREVRQAELFRELVERLAGEGRRLLEMSEVLAEVDVAACLAHLAQQRRYCRPRLHPGISLEIRGGRHPLVEDALREAPFVPNDTSLGQEAHLVILTGPNMAGKSTYLRQVALIALMAHAGSFVPAHSASIGLLDRIFTRVGATDRLSRGLSTFMVEMTETAHILNHASQASLVILDEIGRGTSTFDGVGIAWAVAEHLHDRVGAKTLFATHFHELTELPRHCTRARNYNMLVRESGGEILFLRKVGTGAADRSYGIQVARLAGLPPGLLDRAHQILFLLEASHDARQVRRRLAGQRKDQPLDEEQLDLFPRLVDPLLDELTSLQLDQMTPRAALQKLYELQEALRKR